MAETTDERAARANRLLTKCRDRGNARPADIETLRNDIVAFVAELSAANERAEQQRALTETSAAAFEAGLLQLHADRDYWQDEAVKANERAEMAEVRFARRAELEAAARPLQDHTRRLRDESDRLARKFADGLIAENCDLRTRAVEAEAQRDEALARLAEIGKTREEWGQKYRGGGYLTKPNNDWFTERWPIDDWVRDNTRGGAVVGRRRIIVIEDWQDFREGEWRKAETADTDAAGRLRDAAAVSQPQTRQSWKRPKNANRPEERDTDADGITPW